MTDFPRGWTFQSFTTAGGTSSITVPAKAGVVHVLDSVAASIVALAVAAGINAVGVTIDTGGGPVVYSLLAFNGGGAGRDSDNLTGLDLATPPGGALTVALNGANPANYDAILLIQGHDI